ncbi:hypothetical protein WJX82_002178 [Trebouxia sp. C0006]
MVLIRRELEEAAKTLGDRVRQKDATCEDYFELGVILLRKKLFTQATKNLEKAKKTWNGEPDELAQVYNALGFAYFNMERNELAQAAYRQAVDLQPGSTKPSSHGHEPSDGLIPPLTDADAGIVLQCSKANTSRVELPAAPYGTQGPWAINLWFKPSSEYGTSFQYLYSHNSTQCYNYTACPYAANQIRLYYPETGHPAYGVAYQAADQFYVGANGSVFTGSDGGRPMQLDGQIVLCDHSDSTIPRNYDGALSHLSIYDNALNYSQVLALFHQGVNGSRIGSLTAAIQPLTQAAVKGEGMFQPYPELPPNTPSNATLASLPTPAAFSPLSDGSLMNDPLLDGGFMYSGGGINATFVEDPDTFGRTLQCTSGVGSTVWLTPVPYYATLDDGPVSFTINLWLKAVVRQVLIRRELEEAAKTLGDRVRQKDATCEDYFELGVILLRKKLFTQATKNLEKAKKTWNGEPDELAQVYNALGFAYFNMERNELAQAAYRQAVDLQPG